MQQLRELLSSREIRGIGDYLALSKQIQKLILIRQVESSANIKIAVLSSFTVNGISEVLRVESIKKGIFPEIYVAEYNQYVQEVLNPTSTLYSFEPDLIILFVDTKSILGDMFYLPYQNNAEERRNFIEGKLKEIFNLISKMKEGLTSKILIHNLEVPNYSPYGILEQKQDFGFIESVEYFNIQLRNGYKKDSQVLVYDYNAFCSQIGKANIIDYKMYYLGDMKVDPQVIPQLCHEYMVYIKALKGLVKKCIVLDLDNTLWGGIIGEDGLEGIKLGPTNEGKPFYEFQKYLLALFERGVILAVNSKNNLEDVLTVFNTHPYMVLKEEHFASMQINWNDKISNMKVIAEEINIGLDSLVFFDDDKLNREMIRDALPDVLVIDLPKDPSMYVKTLMGINDFSLLQITEEDRVKGRMYAEQRKRQAFEQSTTDISEYLKGLEMVVTIEEKNPFNLPRIAQLTQKTNQFNMTTRRYTEEDIQSYFRSEKFLVIPIKVEDKFGDNGLTGVAIIEKGPKMWRIDTFLLSCRVIGRRIEDTLLAYIIEQCNNANCRTLVGEFVPTQKNTPATDFYRDKGFKLVQREKDVEFWKYDASRGFSFPGFITLIRR